MTILRWLVFLPIGFITIAITQFLTGFMAELAPWWISVPLVLFFGVILTIATIIPVNIAPNPKIGSTVVLTLFVLFELIALFDQFGDMNGAERTVRVLTDIYLCIGAITARSSPSRRTAQGFGINQAQAAYLDGVAYQLMQEHSKHRDMERTIEGIAEACSNRNDLRYLMKAIDLVLKTQFKSPYRSRAILLTNWQQQVEKRLH
jgi:hypothetical protein